MGNCTIREHVGLEKVIGKLGMSEAIMPDPELGQDVAFLAHVITGQREQIAAVSRERDKFRRALGDTVEALGGFFRETGLIHMPAVAEMWEPLLERVRVLTKDSGGGR